MPHYCIASHDDSSILYFTREGYWSADPNEARQFSTPEDVRIEIMARQQRPHSALMSIAYIKALA